MHAPRQTPFPRPPCRPRTPRALGLLLAVLLSAAALVPTIAADAQGSRTQTASPPESQPPSTRPGSATPGPTTPANAPGIGKDSWSVTPTENDPNHPGTRTNFSYELAPGQSTDDAATLWNYGDQPRVFDIYARDAFNTAEGGIDLLRKEQQSPDVGAWVAFSANQVTVPPRSGISVPFSVTVAKNAQPGDHDGGVVASIVTADAKSSDPNQVSVVHRVGVRMYIRVPGKLDPSLVIEKVETSYSGSARPGGQGEMDLTYTLRNAGNLRMVGRQQLSISGPFSWSIAERTPEDTPELLPGTAVTRKEHFVGVFPAGRLTTTITVTPFALKASGFDAAGAQPVSATTSEWAVPWTLLLTVVLVVLVAWFVLRRARRRGKAKRLAGSGPDKGGGTQLADPPNGPDGDGRGSSVVASDADVDAAGEESPENVPVTAAAPAGADADLSDS